MRPVGASVELVPVAAVVPAVEFDVPVDAVEVAPEVDALVSALACVEELSVLPEVGAVWAPAGSAARASGKARATVFRVNRMCLGPHR
ncbi:hypothetical protein SLNSH_14955 [Alsobacter soli]|uniref:Uncharacterized protein n=1 Tax=Alsobacter soli TaxID=2109933 RepID=A0A2T1HRL4_9HYPH|nr:hypothetical protein SLNSH_14955 [Alsobacter soli]